MFITEALAEIKTIDKRVDKAMEFIRDNLWRPKNFVDPIQEVGGSRGAIEHQLQSINDLFERKVLLRTAIAKANRENTVTIGHKTQTIEEWLIWKREVQPNLAANYGTIRLILRQAREARYNQRQKVGGGSGEEPTDITVNLNEQDFATKVDNLEKIIGELDGQLSLKDATIQLIPLDTDVHRMRSRNS